MGSLCNREIMSYMQIFSATKGEASHLDKVERRYAYIKQKLKAREEAWGVFPLSWRVPQLITLAMCKVRSGGPGASPLFFLRLLLSFLHRCLLPPNCLHVFVRVSSAHELLSPPALCPSSLSSLNFPHIPTPRFPRSLPSPTLLSSHPTSTQSSTPQITRTQVLEMLDAQHHDVPAVLQALHRTLEFERELDGRFGAQRVEEGEGEGDEGGGALQDNQETAAQLRKKYAKIKREQDVQDDTGGRVGKMAMESAAREAAKTTFLGSISGCFEPHMKGCVLGFCPFAQSRALSSVSSQLPLVGAWGGPRHPIQSSESESNSFSSPFDFLQLRGHGGAAADGWDRQPDRERDLGCGAHQHREDVGIGWATD